MNSVHIIIITTIYNNSSSIVLRISINGNKISLVMLSNNFISSKFNLNLYKQITIVLFLRTSQVMSMVCFMILNYSYPITNCITKTSLPFITNLLILTYIRVTFQVLYHYHNKHNRCSIILIINTL